MRRLPTALVLSAIVAISVGSFSRLIAETRAPNAGSALTSLTQAGAWATSQVLPLGKVRVPAFGRLFGQLRTTAQSPNAAAKSSAIISKWPTSSSSTALTSALDGARTSRPASCTS